MTIYVTDFKNCCGSALTPFLKVFASLYMTSAQSLATTLGDLGCGVLLGGQCGLESSDLSAPSLNPASCLRGGEDGVSTLRQGERWDTELKGESGMEKVFMKAPFFPPRHSFNTSHFASGHMSPDPILLPCSRQHPA